MAKDIFKIEGTKIIGLNISYGDDEYEDLVMFDLEIPNGITEIADYAFEYESLTNVYLPKTIKKIGKYSFASSGLQYIELSEGLEEIDDYAFSNNEVFDKIHIPSTIKKIGKNPFALLDFEKDEYYGLNDVKLNKNEYYHIEENCLIETSSQKIVSFLGKDIEIFNIPAYINEIGSFAFCGFKNLKKVNIGYIDKIEYCAFLGCENCELNIDYFYKVEEGAFSNIYQININDDYYKEEDFLISEENVLIAVVNKNKDVYIPGNVHKIGDYAFCNDEKIEAIYFINDSCFEIGQYSFYNCKNLSLIDFEHNLFEIQQSAFESCSNLKDLYLPKSLYEIKDFAFKNCIRLKEVLIPHVGHMGSFVFGCDYYHNNADTRTIYLGDECFCYNYAEDWNDSCLSVPLVVKRKCKFTYDFGIPDFYVEGIDNYDERVQIKLNLLTELELISLKLNNLTYKELEDKLIFNFKCTNRYFDNLAKDTIDIYLKKIILFDKNKQEEIEKKNKAAVLHNCNKEDEFNIIVNFNDFKNFDFNKELGIELILDVMSIEKKLKTLSLVCFDIKDINIEHIDIPQFAKDKIIYIYKGNIRCHKDKHKIIQTTAILHNQTDKEVVLNVEYCTICNKFFLEYTLYELYRKKYGALIGNLRMVVNDSFDGEYDLALESPLRLSGYNVSQKDDYSSQERHYILAKIIYENIMDKGEVIRYISYFIRMNGAKCGNELAVSKWTEDLEFVQNYNMKTQPSAIINETKNIKGNYMCNNLLFLDTNAFYYAANISINPNINNEKLKSYIKNSNCAISNVSFFEFIIKFRNSIDIVSNGLTFLKDNNIRVAINKYFSTDEKLIQECFNNLNETKLNKIIDKIIEIKIDTESRFAATIYSCLLYAGLYFYCFSDSEEISGLRFFIFQECYKMWTKNQIEVFKNLFQDAYKSNDSANKIKNGIQNLLEFSLSVTFSIFEASKNLENEEAFYELIQNMDFVKESKKQKLKILRKAITAIGYISKLAKKYEKFSQDIQLKYFLKNVLKTIPLKIKEAPIKDYICEIVESSYKNGSPFQKNDILDAIIVCNIMDTNSIITFDKKMVKYLNDNKESNYSCRRSVNMIDDILVK